MNKLKSDSSTEDVISPVSKMKISLLRDQVNKGKGGGEGESVGEKGGRNYLTNIIELNL